MNQLQAPSTPVHSQSLSLFDILQILGRHRFRLALVWIAVVAAAVAYLQLVAPVYESRVVLQIGRVAERPVVPQSSLHMVIREQYRLDDAKRPYPRLARVSRENDDALILISAAHDAAEAQRYLRGVVQRLIDGQRDEFDRMRDLLVAELAAAEQQINGMQQTLASLQAAIDQPGTDRALAALVIHQASALRTVLPELHDRRLALQRQLSPVATLQSRVIGEPSLNPVAAEPRKALIMALAVLLGGLLALIVAVLSELARQYRLRDAGDSAQPGSVFESKSDPV